MLISTEVGVDEPQAVACCVIIAERVRRRLECSFRVATQQSRGPMDRVRSWW